MNKLDSKKLFHSVYPFFLTFIVGRLINQTDLIMAGQISADAVAAFAIPVRISIIDMIFAFSLAPVISILVAETSGAQERARVVQSCLTITLYLSLALTVLGLFLYPELVRLLVPNPRVALLASEAVTWLTLSIPLRLCYFAISMAIHGSGQGRFLPMVGAVNLGLNILLNFIFIYPLGFGFAGIYMATFITSVVSLLYAAWVLQNKAGIDLKLRPVTRSWCLQFFKKQMAEFSRVASDRLLSIAEIAIIASALSSALVSFSVGAEFLFLLYTPFVALLRGAAVEITKAGYGDFRLKYAAISGLALRGFLALAVVALVLTPFANFIAKYAYNLPDAALEGWSYIYIFGCWALPLKWIDALQRASFQADKKLGVLAKTDVLIDWLFSIPVMFLGIYWDAPALAFSFFIIAPLLKVVAFHLQSSFMIKKFITLTLRAEKL